MVVDSISHLGGQYECSLHRDFSGDLKTAETTASRQARIQKGLIKDVLIGNVRQEDIESEVFARFKDVPYKSEKGKQAILHDISKRISRFTESVSGKLKDPFTKWSVVADPPKMDIAVKTSSEDVVVKNVAPDLLLVSDDCIYGYRIRTGSPRTADGKVMLQNDLKYDKTLYVLLQYVKEFARQISTGKQNASFMVSAGYCFLRKKSDRPATKKDAGHFDPDFFLNEDGKETDNVLRIYESFRAVDTDGTTGLDETFKRVFDKFLEGYDAEDCTEEQCRDCEMYDICHYKHSPERLNEEKHGTEISKISLSKTQQEIEQFKKGYAIVNAVPGAGKTFVLVLRIISLMLSGVDPSEIVILTFTNSGAEVFKERIAAYNEEIGTGEPVDDMVAATFNGLGQMILEREYKMLGFSAPPKVIDDIERSGIIAELLNKNDVPDLDYRNFTTDMRVCKGPLAVAKKAFEVMKTQRLTVFDAEKIADEVGRAFCSTEAARKLAELYDAYNDYLRQRNLVEYADQEVILLDMLSRDPYYFDQFGWKHILVDECQDTSENQFELLKYMTGTASFESLMVVGDDSQSIYGFRNTSPKFFVNFEKTMGLPYGTVKTFYMTDNFRSTPEIVSFANALIDKNRVKVTKEITAKNHSGDAVTVRGFPDQKTEYEWILEGIKKQIASGTRHEDIAFIASNRTELMKMSSLLTENGIPSVMLNPERYLENSRVRAGLALARFFQDRTSTKDAMVYLNACFGGELLLLSGKQIEAAIALKQQEAARIYSLPEKKFKEEFFKLLRELDEDDEIFESFVDTLEHQRTMAAVFRYCGDFELYGERAERRREHSYPGIVLTTAHSSKGMEWPIVFHSVSRFDDERIHNAEGPQLEEKRRLLFVAATRAKEKLFITGVYIAFGGIKKPSYNRFLLECMDLVGEEVDTSKVLAQITAAREEKKREREKKKQEEQQKFIEDIMKATAKSA